MLNAATPLLSVANIDQSIAFYRCLGFVVVARTLDEASREVMWVMLASDARDVPSAKTGREPIRLMLAAHGGVSHEERKMRPSFAGMVWYLECDDVPALFAGLGDAGYAPEPIETLENGSLQFFVRDPDGYELAVTG
ncbi:VOC family protein [uncultured Thalassospira sp.]|jgi:catechol 2,3-dioxygenase-like lactoylglutathione lyase family enzyme|uniref:VOC family protein n=1 Tax=uncultured Thalassospira sp. TaxID=404382 RepID=UPI0030DBCB68|tara:strand:- start:1421 stop:1831 length:411 start_codon:yes stop_codon:yes gene_type:complete